MWTWTLRLALISTCSTLLACAQTPRILASRDHSYDVVKPKACRPVVLCVVPEDPKRLEECDLVLEEGDGIVPRQLRRRAAPETPAEKAPPANGNGPP